MEIDTSTPDPGTQTLDWALWFYWIIATTSGWLIGNLLFSGIPFIIAGVVIAAMQWAVLYKRIPKAWKWFVLSSLTWIISMFVIILFLPEADLISAMILGGLLGFTQWGILRTYFHWTGWWILISILAWITGLAILPGLFTSGALPGAMTGIALVIFFRYAAKPEVEDGK